jgi:SAM-dependent methyltransferase
MLLTINIKEDDMEEIKECLICGHPLVQVIDLEMMKWMKCPNCHFIQSKFQGDIQHYRQEEKPPVDDKHYEMLLAIVKKASDSVGLSDGDKVLDIGCSNGNLLGWYTKGITVVGIDPSVELIKMGMNEKIIDMGISDFFSARAVLDIAKLMGVGLVKFKIITAVCVLDLVTNPLEFMKDCRELLHDKGVLVIHVNYLLSIMKGNKKDRINDHQFGFYNILPLRELISRSGLDLQGVEVQEDTFRAYITHKSFEKFYDNDYENKLWILNNANIKMVEEMRSGIDSVAFYEDFGYRLSKPIEDTRMRRGVM